jgi:phosphopantetheine adenylyltransferase
MAATRQATSVVNFQNRIKQMKALLSRLQSVIRCLMMILNRMMSDGLETQPLAINRIIGRETACNPTEISARLAVQIA